MYQTDESFLVVIEKGGSIFGQKFWFNAVGKKVEYLWMYYKDMWLVILAKW